MPAHQSSAAPPHQIQSDSSTPQFSSCHSEPHWAPRFPLLLRELGLSSHSKAHQTLEPPKHQSHSSRFHSAYPSAGLRSAPRCTRLCSSIAALLSRWQSAATPPPLPSPP